MKQSDSPRPRYIGLAIVAAVAAAFYWFGYRQGSESAWSQIAQADESSTRNTVSSDSAAVTPEAVDPSPRVVAKEPTPPPSAPSEPDPQETLSELVDRLARSLPPSEALAYLRSASLSDQERAAALRGLVSAWIANRSDLSDEEIAEWQGRIGSINGAQFGLEVELGLAVADAKLDRSIAQAWMDAYAEHPGRSKLFAGLLAEQFRSNPLAALSESSTWTAWEQRQFERNLFRDWTLDEPQAALDWYSENSDAVGEEIGSEILDTLARSNPELAGDYLSNISDPERRRTTIENIATSLAQAGTEKALNWVDSLRDESERNAAMEAVYHATPQGIGAMMGRKDGFPLIVGLVPGGPLETTGLMPGDLVVQATETGGNPIDLYGLPMGEFVSALRGEPGSEVEIRILRENPQTSQLEESRVRVTRDVLIIPPSGKRG